MTKAAFHERSPAFLAEQNPPTMSPPRLALFGTPTLQYDGSHEGTHDRSHDGTHEGRNDALPFERRHQLVVLLALEHGWVTRARIAALLWPEQPRKLAYTNLRKTLFRLQALPWAQAIKSQSAALRFDAMTDVAAFESALAAGRLDEALALVRGELLAGFDDGSSEAWTQWLRYERERLRVTWRAAALERAATLDASAAITLTARLLQADGLDEVALRAHMQALARDGQATAARQAYRRFAEHVTAELGIEPDVQSRALHESLHEAPTARLPTSLEEPAHTSLAAPSNTSPAAPSHASLAAPSNNAAGSTPPPRHDAAPRQDAHGDGFVGRAVELQRIAELLARDECRLLCLVGPGGVGKTRLARRAMEALADRFADGACFVELEDAETPTHVAQRLADALDVRAGADALRATTAALAGREALLVLDNIEQLVEDFAALVEPILAAAPRVKLLVTSRMRLNVALAWSMPLEGLPVPDPEDDDRAETFDAIRLFVQATQRVAPALSWAAERTAIVDICRQLEGLPLALELAAAWTRVLPCTDIAAELRHGHELLRAQDTAQPARHASIGVVFDESWRRLSAAERRALARLSVFRGGFTAEAARAVAGVALPVLGALVDKSLLRKDEARLALHPLLQQLAAAKLDDEGGNARGATEAAHAAYFHAWLARVQLASEQGQAATLAAIDVEIENCRQAWSVAIASGDGDAITHSAPTLLHLVEHRARFEDGLALWQQAIDAPVAQARLRAPSNEQLRLRAQSNQQLRLPTQPDQQPRLRALLLAQAALIEYRLARFDAAQARATLALAQTSNAADDRDARYQALSVLASCAMSTGRFAQARRLFLRALVIARARARPHEVAGTLENLALAAKRLGDYNASLRLNVEALAEHRRSGAGAGEALSLSNLASLEMFKGRNDAAASHLQEALALCERHGLTSTHVLVLANLTELTIASGDVAQARKHAERAFVIAQGASMRAVVGWLEIQRSRLSMREGQIDDARARLAAGCTLALELRQPSLKAAALLALGELFEAQGRPEAAHRVLDFGIGQDALSAPDREELRAQRASRGPQALEQRAWPGMSLDGLLQQVVLECTSARAGLIAELG